LGVQMMGDFPVEFGGGGLHLLAQMGQALEDVG